jgi:hypothetical protein
MVTASVQTTTRATIRKPPDLMSVLREMTERGCE